jgi:LysM repeat protein
MKNRISILICLIFTVSAGFSQNSQLIIEGTTGKFYLIHSVVAKENWYSIGRLFNLSPHEIASFNNMSFDKPLEVATNLKIPLTPSNFDQKQVKSAGESLIPVYHVVQEKEWMFKVSSVYNDVPVTSLEKWNKIKRDDVKKGTPLIVDSKSKNRSFSLAMGVFNPATGNNPPPSPVTTTQIAAKSTTNPTSGTALPNTAVQNPNAVQPCYSQAIHLSGSIITPLP